MKAPHASAQIIQRKPFDPAQLRRIQLYENNKWQVEKAVAWISIFKTAACFLGGGALMGLLRGSMTSGVLAGVILFALFLAVAGAVIAVDRAGRRAARRATAMQKQQRELAGGSMSAPLS